MTDTAMVKIAMYGWPLLSLFFFVALPPRRAVLMSIMGGWLILPQAAINIQGLPDYTRFTAALLGAFLGVVFFDLGRLFQIRWRWFDLFALLLCICPLPTSISNELGAFGGVYDGASAIFQQCTIYGFPYVLGRLYFSDRDGIRDLAISFIIAALVFAPFCLLEMRLSPRFHYWVYGYHTSSLTTVKRLGGYRPRVFFRSGIETGMLMAAASLISFWLWRARSIKSVSVIPIAIVTAGVTSTFALCRALNGYGLYILGLVCTGGLKWFRLRVMVAALVLAPAGYIGLRVMTGWEAKRLTDLAYEISPDRAASLRSRIGHEVRLIEHAWKRPIFGWGGYSRNRPDFFGDDTAAGTMGNEYVTDSLWIVVFGKLGLVGLVSLCGVFVLPPCLLTRRLPAGLWLTPEFAPAGALALVLGMFFVDCLFNAMLNPIYFVAAGALMGFYPAMTAIRQHSPAQQTAMHQQRTARISNDPRAPITGDAANP